MRLPRPAPVLLALALAACAGAAPPGARAPQVPASWTNVVPATASAPAAAIADDWWTVFGSDELAALVVRAVRDNPDLAAGAQRIAAATARARAAGAGLMPSLDATGGMSRGWRGEAAAGNGFRGAFDAGYEIDVWGGNRASAAAAAAAALAARWELDAVALGLRAEVATTYFQLLSLQDRIANARRILDIAERVLDLVQQRQALGAASGLEVLQQRGAVSSLRATIPQLQQRRAETANALAELLGAPPGSVAVRASSLDAVALPAVAPGLPSDLLRRRPDLMRAEAAIEAARADAEAARAAMLPRIRLTGSSGYSSDALSSLLSPAGFLADLASGLVGPVFDGGRLAAARDGAVAAQAQAVEDYRGAVVAAFRDVEDALAAARFLAETEAEQRAALADAEAAYALAEVRFRAGAADFLTLLETQRSLFQQEDALAQTRFGRLAAAIALYRALGGGWSAGPAAGEA
jgi:NodT family efflux transporter outer membrane factor (OMF) lipoprotein